MSVKKGIIAALHVLLVVIVFFGCMDTIGIELKSVLGIYARWQTVVGMIVGVYAGYLVWIGYKVVSSDNRNLVKQVLADKKDKEQNV